MEERELQAGWACPSECWETAAAGAAAPGSVLAELQLETLCSRGREDKPTSGNSAAPAFTCAQVKQSKP